jgi:hypothetical protein
MKRDSAQLAIAPWLREFASKQELRRDDRHIDEIDASYTDRRRWIGAALLCYSVALESVRSDRLPVIVAMQFFLKPSSAPKGLDATSAQRLQLSWTPPALTLFRRGFEPWTGNDAFVAVELETGLPEGALDAVYYQEWFDESDADFDRRLWIVGEG